MPDDTPPALSSPGESTPDAPSAGPLLVGLGEVLFDCFPNREVLGGAPTNVAIHARRLLGAWRGRSAVLTRIGDDERGRRFLDESELRGVDTRWVQTDPDRATGTVSVSFDATGEPVYDFAFDAAWDHLVCDTPSQRLAASCDAVVFGTLAQRSDESRQASHRFLAAAQHAVRVLDVNLRQEFFDAGVLDQSLRLATAAKLNAAELSIVAGLLDITPLEPWHASAEGLRGAYQLDWLAITEGAAGTTLFTDAGPVRGEPAAFEPVEGADPVGAGDACCAALVCALLVGLTPVEAVTRANRVGAYVAGRPGATPQLPDKLLPRPL